VNERVSADTPLNADTRIMAIGNPPEIAEDGWELGAPMSNRFFHIRGWELPAEVFALGLTTGQWASVPVLEVDAARLISARAEITAAIAGFIRHDVNARSKVPDNPSERQYSWPSPRSWTLCSNLLAYAHAANIESEPISDEVITLLVEGCVGPSVSAPFLAFLSALDMPTPESLLASPSSWTVPERGDLAWAVLSRVIQHLVNLGEDATKDDWWAGGEVVAHAADGQGDVAVAIAQDWWAHARKYGPTVMPPALASGRFANVLKLINS
jgi:hypothetical protein